MKLIGDLKKQVEQTASREGKRAAIAKAGMLLNDDELDQVSGGWCFYDVNNNNAPAQMKCEDCGAMFPPRTSYCPFCRGKNFHVVER